MRQRRRIVVMGILGRLPYAGVAWQVLHYLVGFKRLGHDVYYVEDTQTWPYNSETGGNDCSYTVKYINRLLAWCDLGDRWAFCDVSQGGRVFGPLEFQISQILNEADAIINVTGSTELRDKHLRVPVRVYLETDPGVPQIEVAQGNPRTIDFIKAHTHHFTYAENFGRADCGLPVGPIRYCPTRQPIILDWWKSNDSSRPGENLVYSNCTVFTTIASWKQSRDIVWNGDTYTWSKDKQFLKFVDLPARSRQSFELALACDDQKVVTFLESHGWRIKDAIPLTNDIFPYRAYIAGSKGEFTVAKDQYSRLRTGWFSDRSASYLAAGSPVITQDTGFGNILPTGRGLFAFTTMEEILTALDTIDTDYEGHCRAAREIAIEYFAAEKVLERLMMEIGL